MLYLMKELNKTPSQAYNTPLIPARPNYYRHDNKAILYYFTIHVFSYIRIHRIYKLILDINHIILARHQLSLRYPFNGIYIS